MKKIQICLVSVLLFFYAQATMGQAVTLSSPSNGSTTSGVSVNIYWNGISGNTHYDYQYDIVATFNSSYLVTGTKTSSYSSASLTNLRYGQTYYWRVRARNANDTTVWTSAWKFTTPSTMTLSSPSNNSTLTTIAPTLYWNTISGSSNYDYEIDITPNFNSPSLIKGSKTSSYNSTSLSNLKYGTTYYWHVRARNAVDTTVWSATWQFTTASPNMTLSSPNNGSQVSGVT
ncbi:MAG: hypothetical protein MJZ76_06305, partial [Bacteroidales bacterium]|nr:hypothetical protein [Bacteroidales bacterium]